MEHEGSVSEWLNNLKDGDEEAARMLWDRYFDRLKGLAARLLKSRPQRIADEEDVALSAFAAFCDAASNGRHGDVEHRESLWRVLAVITHRKVVRLFTQQTRQKRGAGKVRGDSAIREQVAGGKDFDDLAGDHPDAAYVAAMAEQVQGMLDRLGDDTLCHIATWKLEGLTNHEIATRLKRSDRTVERKLKLIREIWEAQDRT